MKKQPLLVVVAATTIVAAGYFGLGVKKVEGAAPAMISGCQDLFKLENAVEVATANVTSVAETKEGKTHKQAPEKAYGVLVGQEVIVEVTEDDIDCNGPIDGMFPKPNDEDTLIEMPKKEFDQNGPIDGMFPKPKNDDILVEMPDRPLDPNGPIDDMYPAPGDKRPIDAKEDEFDRNGPIDGMYPAPNTTEKNA